MTPSFDRFGARLPAALSLFGAKINSAQAEQELRPASDPHAIQVSR